MLAASYEVFITVRTDLQEAFESFMIAIHIPDVMSTGVFSNARFAMLEPGRYKASYTAASQEDLDTYLRDHSPRLRDDVTSHFPEGLVISREKWKILAEF